jgi:steroid delta-isomerase-like uncharacterized protein
VRSTTEPRLPLLARLGRTCHDRRWWVLGLWIATLIGLGAVMGGTGTGYSTEYSLPDVESAHGFDTIDEHFGGQGGGATGTIVFAYEGEGGVTSPEVQEPMSTLFDEVGGLADVDRVLSPYAGNERAFDALDTIVAANFVRHSQATPDLTVGNLEQFKAFLRQDAATFPDSRVTTHQLVAEGDRVAFHGTYAGTQEGPMGPFPASGKRMEIEFFGVFRIEDDRIAELWVAWDNLAALTQLGHWPPG